MAPRGHTLPQAATESAREARKSFFCELCQKGYARMNDFEAHEGSYDHQHRKRLKEMRHLTKDPNAQAKARAAEQKANEEAGLKTINLSSISSSTAKSTSTSKKPMFKSTLQPHNAAAVGQTDTNTTALTDLLPHENNNDPSGAVRNGWHEDRYQPRWITPCGNGEGCGFCVGKPFDLEGVCVTCDEDVEMARA